MHIFYVIRLFSNAFVVDLTAQTVRRREREAMPAVRGVRLRWVRSRELYAHRPSAGRPDDRRTAQVQELVRMNAHIFLPRAVAVMKRIGRHLNVLTGVARLGFYR